MSRSHGPTSRPAAPRPAGKSRPGTDRRSWSRGDKIAAAALLFTVLFGVAAWYYDSRSVDAPQANATSAPDSPAAVPGDGVSAVIQNTWDSGSQSLVGVYKYPRADSNEGRVNGPGEGAAIQVVCQVLDGRLVTDTPYKDRPTSSTVWNRLADGYYVSDIYTSLPKQPGQLAPGVPAC